MVRSAYRLLVVSLCVTLSASCGGEPTESSDSISTGETDASSAQEAADAPLYSLEAADTAYLWDLEHHGNVLVSHGFGAFGSALGAADGDALAGLLAETFTGSVIPIERKKTEIGNKHLFSGRHERVGDAGRDVDAAGLVKELLGIRSLFAEPPRFSWGVKRITPGDREDLDVPWTALCAARMWGESSRGGPAEVSLLLALEFERPSKELMSEPGWLRRVDLLQISHSWAEQPLFREALSEYGIDRRWFHDNWRSNTKVQAPGGVYAWDFDRDQCIDLLLTDEYAQGNLLLHGRPGGGFTDVTAAVGLIDLQVDPDLDVALVDVDGDGWEDVVLGQGTVYRNVLGERFEPMTDHSNFRKLGSLAGKRSSISVVDFDRDGRMDLYVARAGGLPTSWIEDAGDSPHRNTLLRNVGDWQFEDVTSAMGIDGGPRSTFTSAWFDANNDLWPDCYVINEFGDGVLYVNEEGRSFREIDADPAKDDFGSMGVVTGDIDNDGNIDLYIAAMYSKAGSRVIGNLPADAFPEAVSSRLARLIDGSELYRNQGELAFTAAGASAQIHDVGWAWGPALADFDNDGRLDVYAPAGYMSRDRSEPDG